VWPPTRVVRIIPTVRSIADHLRTIAGDGAVLPASAARAFAAGVGDAVTVVAPDSADAVAAVLAACAAEGWRVEPAGAGTWLFARRRVSPPHVVLSTRRLAAIHEYEPADLTIGVGAGASLASIAETLAPHRQWLALDPPAAAGATIGATVALNAAGPMRHAFGTPRDAALGIEVATGDGRLLRFGGRVVKNVAGYDVVRLLVGSRGALGVITRLHLRLRPLADHDVTWSLPSGTPDPARAEELAREIEPAALEWCDGALLVRVHGNADAIDWAAAQLAERGEARRLDAKDADATWQALARREAEATFVARFTTPPAALSTTHTIALELRRALPKPDDATIVAHAADGIVRVVAAAPAFDDATWRALAPALEAARRAAQDAGASVRYEPLPVVLADVAAFEPQGERERELTAGIMRHFDPAGVLASGA
jgi:glycolate oxidase FAD binding subunit